MKQVNCTVVGRATDTPFLVIDNGHSYMGQFESPSRVLFFVPDSEPPWGATFHYGAHTLRYIIPVQPGAYEGPELRYTPDLPRFTVAGNQLAVNGKVTTWAMMSGFCDYKVWLDGGAAALQPLLEQARDLGSNGRRVLGMMAFIADFNPRTYGDRFYTELKPFVDFNAQFHQRLHFDVFADNQVINLGVDHWARTCDQLRPLESVVIGAGNEWPKNGFDPTQLPYPGVLSSQGSSLSDSAPPMPGWGIRCWHGRRDDKVFLSADDMWFVGMGRDEEKGQYAPVSAVVHDEPMGFAEVDQPGRRSTDPRLAQSLMLTARGYGAGATFHSEDGMYSRLLGSTQQTCARAFFDAQ